MNTFKASYRGISLVPISLLFAGLVHAQVDSETVQRQNTETKTEQPTISSGLEQGSETTQLIQSLQLVGPERDPDLQVPLKLLDKTVQPGESAILPWLLESSFSDISAPSSVLVVNGTKPGPTLCLTAAIHGDELNGIEIVRRVMYDLKAEKLTGAVIGIPIVNLEGFKRASRYLPDRRDLNRYFPGRLSGSYASRIAHSFFYQIVKKCDYLIDIHTGSLDRTNLPQIRADLNQPRVADLASKMGSIVVLQSRGGTGTLRRAATDAGIAAVTLETGAPNNLQKEAVENGVGTMSAALRSLGFTAKSIWKGSKEPVYYRSVWVRAKQGGILFSKVSLGDSIKQGTLLGLLSNPITNKTTEIRSTLEGQVIGMALNQIMYPGFAAYHIGLKSSAVEAAQPPLPANELELDLAQTDKLDENTKESEIPVPKRIASGESDNDKTSQIKEAATIEEMELPTADDSD